MAIIFLRRITSLTTATEDGSTRKRRSSVSSLLRILGRNSGYDPGSSAPPLSGEGGPQEDQSVLFPKDVPPSYTESLLDKSSSQPRMNAPVQDSLRSAPSMFSQAGSGSDWPPATTCLPPASRAHGQKEYSAVPLDTVLGLSSNNHVVDITPPQLHRSDSEMRLSPRLTLRRPHLFHIPTLPTIDVTLPSPSQVCLGFRLMWAPRGAHSIVYDRIISSFHT